MTVAASIPASACKSTYWPHLPPSPLKLEDRAWPRISVVMPSYNQGEFIEEAIRSVILQGYPNLELIVMDGCSSDQSVQIIRKYEPWIAHWVSEKDEGQSAAINAGWGRATGEIVAWLNADDLYCENALLNAARRFLDEPDTAMVYGYADVIDEYSRPIGTMKVPDQFDLCDMIRSFNNIVPSVTMFVRKDCVSRVGDVRTDLHYTMDFEFVMRVGLQGQILRDRGIRSLVRVHGSAKSSLGGTKGLDEMYSAVASVLQKTRDPEIATACRDGLALGGTRLSATYARQGAYTLAVLWRLRSFLRALSGANRKEMMALLLPGSIFPFVRKYRADAVERSVHVVWTDGDATDTVLRLRHQ